MINQFVSRRCVRLRTYLVLTTVCSQVLTGGRYYFELESIIDTKAKGVTDSRMTRSCDPTTCRSNRRTRSSNYSDIVGIRKCIEVQKSETSTESDTPSYTPVTGSIGTPIRLEACVVGDTT